ncbi:TlpA family protein disulfide reductase [Phyllobacterium salinisoli]|uniref:TlpA family protein disulfide reductase n=1 Tax=Phyllobacterium salinisoli TaxID=1899321 RepID=A0A368JZ92_9HYPH|nr:TlpA disulfide reductase family protein [Phyllobacterium salinisoli]RCS22447.1 TlpA family protein disulfide reductase [Phyllobacterium salinisoli]
MAAGSKDGKAEKPGSGRIVLLAGLAGLIAGAVAVYVMERPSGNVAQSIDIAADGGQCAMKADAAKALDAAATGSVAAMRAAETPQPVQNLAFTGPDGRRMTLADFKSKTLLVNLWATWCAPCREEMPALDKLQAEEGGEDFQVVAINIDTGDDTKPKAFLSDLSETGVRSLNLYRDATMGVFNELKRKNLAFGLPVTMLVDKDGCQIAAMNGPADWAGDDAKKLIAAARKIDQ